ncbi:MAG TPA: SRPBCC domain-containing protein [Candidatus Angelobacter sp.]|nr:SRPBCC domain-containing protein [Candidatus Angelobacter sp.]
MPNRKTRKFEVSHTEHTVAKPHQIWALWSNVNHWPKWDLGLKATELKHEFAVGSKFKLLPQGAEQAITSEIKAIEPNKKFADITQLPFGTIEAVHELEEVGGKTKVTHRIVALIDEDQADMFSKQVWKNIEKGLSGSVKKLTELAEKS